MSVGEWPPTKAFAGATKMNSHARRPTLGCISLVVEVGNIGKDNPSGI
jgi:hypothetical protein